MFSRFVEFFSDGAGALPLALLICATPPALVLWLNVTVIMGGN
jgi:hypothetical protein